MSKQNSVRIAGLAVLIFAGAAYAGESLWITDYAAAKTQAKAEKKLILANFTGSDWCGWCIKLDEEVFSHEEFKTAAPKKFVLLELDFPNKKTLPEALVAQNQKLQAEFNVTGYPTIYVLDADGHAVAKTGYKAGGPEKYLAELNGYVTAYENIVALQGKLPDAKGLDRAKLLDEILTAQEKLGTANPDAEKLGQEIMTLDADNKGGLKAKYTVKGLLASAEKLMEAEKFADAKAACEKARAVPGIAETDKQDAYFIEGKTYFSQKDFVNVVECLKKARDAAPASDKVTQLDGMIKRFQTFADAQTDIAKYTELAEKSQGLERAKALDPLIDAKRKLIMLTEGPRAAPSPELEKWTQEIMTLDADNKAGLRTKYQFRALVVEASKELKAGDADKAGATVARALALPGVTDEQKAAIEKLKAAIDAKKAQPPAAPAPTPPAK